MRCLFLRTEVFGKTEIQSYCFSEIDDEEMELSVFKAKIIRQIEDQTSFMSRFPPETFKDYGIRSEDRYYVFNLKNWKGRIDKLEKEFLTVVFNNEKATNINHEIPRGWEEILLENYNIKEVAFRKKVDKMTELEKKAEIRCDLLEIENCEYTTFWLDGYKQGQKDMPLSGQLVHEVEILKKENEELKAQIERMKCCVNCKYYGKSKTMVYDICKLNHKEFHECIINNKDKWELAE